MSGGEENKEKGKVVCVTGASGYIASWLIKNLLQRGYTVHGTLRNPNDEAKTKHIMKLEGANERLLLFKADLMHEGSFDSAISGCQGVFHVASPVNYNVIDPQVDVLDPALKGTLNVLATCKRTSSVRRVVLTSSMATVLFNGRPRSPEVVVDESWFSKPEYCDDYPGSKWYVISKVLAEEAAWKFCKENGIDLITMNPSMVIGGHMLPPTLPESVGEIVKLINGAKTYLNVAIPWVDIEDVVEAHIRGYEMPSAHGRYCLAERVIHHSEIVNLLHELHDPSLLLPHKCGDDGPLAKTYQVSKTKVQSLGIEYIPFQISLKNTIQSIKDKKFLTTTKTY